MKKTHFLRNFPFFQDLEEEDLDKLSPLFLTRTYEKGTDVFREGEAGDELYIIHSGIVKIYRDDEVRDIILAVFRDGDFFGEMALLGNEQVRSASAKTMENCFLRPEAQRFCLLGSRHSEDLIADFGNSPRSPAQDE